VEWSQDDWAGGAGQALLEDETRYSDSSRIDTTSGTGSLRLSFILTALTKAPNNPVLKAGGTGSWDENYVSGWPRARDGEAGYELIYRSADAANVTALGYATSPDGTTWTKYGGNPVLTRTSTDSWQQNGVGRGPLLESNGTYLLFFQGYGLSATTSYFSLARSNDLINWTRMTNSYVFGPGDADAWDELLQTINVHKDESGYHLWYLARDLAGGTAQIGYAWSTDGMIWTRSGLNPVLPTGSAGAFDDNSLISFYVLPRPWAGDYLLVYSAVGSSGHYGIGTATSPDGVTWTKNPANPIFLNDQAGTWYSYSVNILRLGFDGSTYKIQIYGIDTPSGDYASGELWSDDATVWWTNAANPLLTASADPAWDDILVAHDMPFLEGDTARVFYVGAGTTSNAFLGTATCSPRYHPEGTLTSSVYDAESTVEWRSAGWQETKPAGTDVALEVRCGGAETPDAAWTSWAAVSNGGTIPHGSFRYIQYRLTLSTSDAGVSPVVTEISFTVTPPIDLTPDKTTFSTTDTIRVTAAVQPIGTRFYPVIRLVTSGGRTLYYTRGKGFSVSPRPYLSGGPYITRSEINGYTVMNVRFAGVQPGTYYLEGGAVDATQTTSVNNLVYAGSVDRETLTVR
jgi:hypothetical protein